MCNNTHVKRIILLIDGENLRHYVEDVIKLEGHQKEEFSIVNIDFDKMFSNALKGLGISQKTYYSAKIHLCQETPEKSRKIIEKQRVLKSKLEKIGYNFTIDGNVRAQTIEESGKKRIVFKEKGVDVRIAVDLVKIAFDKNCDTVVLCSSDSDLQPAIKEARSRGLEIIYLGFEMFQNKGLSYTTNRTILLRNSEIIDSLDRTSQLEIPIKS